MTIDVVAIAGAGRSGSTLLESLAASRLGSVSVGELVWIWERGFTENQLCGCGSPVWSCPFWTSVVDTAFGGFEHVPSERVAELVGLVQRRRHVPYLLGWRSASNEFHMALAEYRSILTKLYTAISTVGGGRPILDSSKHAIYLHVVAGAPDIDVTTVHLVRDPRAVVFSWSRPKLRPEVHWETRYMPTYGTYSAATMWVGDNIFAALLRSRTPYRMMRYEDLARDPEGTVEQMQAFAASPDEPGGPPIEHAIGGNPSRFGDVRPVRVDDRWRSEMTRRDKVLTWVLTWPLIARWYGRLM